MRPRVPWIVAGISLLFIGGGIWLFLADTSDTPSTDPPKRVDSVIELPDDEEPRDARRRSEIGKGDDQEIESESAEPLATDSLVDRPLPASFGILKNLSISLIAASSPTDSELAHHKRTVAGIATTCGFAVAEPGLVFERDIADRVEALAQRTTTKVRRFGSHETPTLPCVDERVKSIGTSTFAVFILVNPTATSGRILAPYLIHATERDKQLTNAFVGHLGATLKLPQTLTPSTDQKRLLLKYGLLDESGGAIAAAVVLPRATHARNSDEYRIFLDDTAFAILQAIAAARAN